MERVDTIHGPIEVVDLVPVGLVAPLPPVRPGRYLLVSAALRAAVGRDRDDLLVVHDRRFDPTGQVTSCRALGRLVNAPRR